MKDFLNTSSNKSSSNNFPTTLKNIKLKIRLIQKRKQLESINTTTSTTSNCKGEHTEISNSTSGRNHRNRNQNQNRVHCTFQNLTNQLADLKFDNNNNNSSSSKNNNNKFSGGVYLDEDEDNVRKLAAASAAVEEKRRKNSLFKAYFNFKYHVNLRNLSKKPPTSESENEEYSTKRRRRRRRRRSSSRVINHFEVHDGDGDDNDDDKKVHINNNNNNNKRNNTKVEKMSSLANNRRNKEYSRRNNNNNNKTVSSSSDDDDEDVDDLNNKSGGSTAPIYVFRKGGKTYLANLIEEENEEKEEEEEEEEEVVVEFGPENSSNNSQRSTKPTTECCEIVEVEELPVKLKEICEQNKLILRKFYGNFGLLMNYISPSLDYKIGELDMSLLSRGLSNNNRRNTRKTAAAAAAATGMVKSDIVSSRLTLNPSRQTFSSIDMSTVHWPSAMSTTLRKPATITSNSSSLLLLSRLGGDSHGNHDDVDTEDGVETSQRYHVKLPTTTTTTTTTTTIVNKSTSKKRRNLDILKINGKSLIKEPVQGVTNLAATWSNASSLPASKRDDERKFDVKVVREQQENVTKLPDIETKRSSCEQERNEFESKSMIQQFISQRSLSSVVDYKKVYDYLPLEVDKIEPSKRSDELISKSDQQKDQKRVIQKRSKPKLSISLDAGPKSVTELISDDKINNKPINPILSPTDNNSSIKEETSTEFFSESLLVESASLSSQKLPVRKSTNEASNKINSSGGGKNKSSNKTVKVENKMEQETTEVKVKKQQQQQHLLQSKPLNSNTIPTTKRSKNMSQTPFNNGNNNNRRKTFIDLDTQLPKSQGVYTQVLTSTSQLSPVKSLVDTSLFTDATTDNNNNSDDDRLLFTNFDTSSTMSMPPQPQPQFDRANTEFLSSLQEVNRLKKRVLQRIQRNHPNVQASRPDLLPTRSATKDVDIYKFYERSRTSFIIETTTTTTMNTKPNESDQTYAENNNDSIDDS